MGRPKKPEKSIVQQNKEYRAKKRAQGKRIDRSGRVMSKSPYTDKPMLDFWKNVDRDQMRKALQESDSSAAHALVGYMLEKNVSMSRACRECGITLQKLNELYSKHQLAIGLIHANYHLPDVIASTAEDAKAAYELCDRCDGEGQVTRTRIMDDKPQTFDEVCPKCRGERQVRISGDAKARDQIFKMTGVLGEDKGVSISVNQNMNFGDTLGDTLGAAQRILTQRPKIIDVEPEQDEDTIP